MIKRIKKVGRFTIYECASCKHRILAVDKEEAKRIFTQKGCAIEWKQQ